MAHTNMSAKDKSFRKKEIVIFLIIELGFEIISEYALIEIRLNFKQRVSNIFNTVYIKIVFP
tara:strand:- start:886 stop:1071 length:186 start_codon:yes stop_codon:yes gene_type:complete